MDVSFGPYRMRLHTRELIGPAGPLALGARSFDLLAALLDRPNELVSKADILDTVWSGVAVEENTLQVHMSGLRKALGEGYISTVHGRGYRYIGPSPVEHDVADEPTHRRRDGSLHRYQVDCVARDAEKADVVNLLRSHRLVTIVGAGGVGKTTLALAASLEVAAQFEDGVWVVDLAPIADPALVESTIIQALGIGYRSATTPLRSIVDHLRRQSAMLVLDNCEHVIAQVANVVRGILDEAPRCCILATSQTPIGLRDEALFKLAPFRLSAAGSELMDAPAAQFLAHCYELLGEKLSPTELPAVAKLCRRLDGVALAIKMAAARSAALGIEAVERQVASQIAGLEVGWSDAIPRHRSLTASLNWSYGLLSPDHQRALRSLSVFQGTFSLAGIVAVVGGASEQVAAELVQRSLVVRDNEDRNRFRLLESTHQFALGRLQEANEEVTARDRHAAFVVGLMRAGLEDWQTQPDGSWFATYAADSANLRAALDWARSRADWTTFVQLAAYSYRYWIEAQLIFEGLAVCEEALALADDVEEETVAALRVGIGGLARIKADDAQVKNVVEPAIAFFRLVGDKIGLAQAVALKGTVLTGQMRTAEAIAAFEEIEPFNEELPLCKAKAWSLIGSGTSRWLAGDRAIGLARFDAGYAMLVEGGGLRNRFRAALYIAEILHRGGDNEAALHRGGETVNVLRTLGTPQELGYQLNNLAIYAMSAGDLPAAKAYLAEAMTLVPRDGTNWHWCLLQNAAEMASLEGSSGVAALLLGYTDGRFGTFADGRQKTETMQRERIIARLEVAILPAELAKLLQDGQKLGWHEADALAAV